MERDASDTSALVGSLMTDDDIERHLARIDADGYTIIEDAIAPDLVAELRDAVRGVFAAEGIEPKGNRAEGFATRRIYNLIPRSAVFEQLPLHGQVLPVVEQLLEQECLLSGTTAMDIGPGECLQGLHADDGLIRVRRPHPPMMATTIWALTEFTAENGATRLVPGSHKQPGHPNPDDESLAIAAEMAPGSVLIMDAQTWHCGGPNTTADQWRLGLNVQYVRGFLRTQQNHYLGVPPEKVAGYPRRLRQLLGYELYRGIMGHVDGLSPAAAIGADSTAASAYAASSTTNPFGDREVAAKQG